MHHVIDNSVVVLPKFFKAPEVGGVVLQVLHLDPDDRPRWWALLLLVRVADGQQVGGEGGVEGLGEEDELERHLLL